MYNLSWQERCGFANMATVLVGESGLSREPFGLGTSGACEGALVFAVRRHKPPEEGPQCGRGASVLPVPSTPRCHILCGWIAVHRPRGRAPASGPRHQTSTGAWARYTKGVRVTYRAPREVRQHRSRLPPWPVLGYRWWREGCEDPKCQSPCIARPGAYRCIGYLFVGWRVAKPVQPS